MGEINAAFDEDRLVVEVSHTQLAHFRNSDPPCRGLQLPDGILLRHTLSRSLYVYFKTAVVNGKIQTRVFASDSPYDRQRTIIGEVATPMFESRADRVHLEKLEDLLRDWVDFVREEPEQDQDFRSFTLGDR